MCYENHGYTGYIDGAVLALEMKRGTTIEYLKCRALRADLNFEVDFGVNGAIGAIVVKWNLILYWPVRHFIHFRYV